MFTLLFVSSNILTLIEAQIFRQFGFYEYYWPIEEDAFVGSYSEAEEECRKLDATLVVINTQAIGNFLETKIENMDMRCKL